MLKKMFTKKVVAVEAITLLVVAIAAVAAFVSPVAASLTAGTFCILAGVAVQLYTGSDFINRHFGWLVIGSSILAAIAALTAGILSGQLVMGIISAVAALLIILAVTVLKKQWVHLVFAVVSMVAMITMVLPVKAAEPAVTEEESDEDDSKDDEILAEIKGLRADLAELMQANEELRRMYEEYVARCKDCPICNGTMTLDELQKGNSTTKTGVKKTSNGIAYVGAPLGDGKGNGAGLTPVKLVYDDVNKTEYKAPDKDVDFTDDKDDDKDVDVDDNHGDYPHAGDDQDDKPQVEGDDKTEKTQDLTYSVEGSVVTVKAPEGFVAVDDVLSYIVAKGGVTVTTASAEANILTITFDASEDAKIVVCKGMFKNGDVKSAELEVSVKKSEKAEEEDPSSKDDDDSNKPAPENPAPVAPTPEDTEMVVSAINVQAICDTAFEGDALQYVVVAEGQNVDYSRLAVSAGAIGTDGTWTIIAPAESGSATVSFGDVSATVNFTVEAPHVEEPIGPGTDEPSEDEPSVDEPKEEEVKGTLTAVSLYDSSVVCGSVIQGEISCEGNVNWSEVEVSGLNGLNCDITDGIITIETSDVASSYEVTVSYNGSSVSASFDVEGVEDADIVWE